MRVPSINTLDIEASGIHPQSYPIEIGVILTNGDTYCSLISPPTHWQHWCNKAEQIHGISREELIENGKPARQVAEDLNDMLTGKTVYSDCWVLDKPWLIKLFHEADVQLAFSLSDIIYKLSEKGYQDLPETKQHISKELCMTRHRATNDARILQLAYQRIRQVG